MLMVQLQLADAAARHGGSQLKLDVLLSDAGFGPKEIAPMLGRSATAVAKSISRARAGRKAGVVDKNDSPGEDDV
jgi:DNA-directed RNA polymerase specialized sigma24 family protein